MVDQFFFAFVLLTLAWVLIDDIKAQSIEINRKRPIKATVPVPVQVQIQQIETGSQKQLALSGQFATIK